MASNANPIIQAIQFGIQHHLEKQRLAQQQANLESEQALRKAEAERFTSDLEERKRQFDVTHKASQALMEAQLEQYRQNVSKNILEGIPVPGEQAIPVPNPQGGQPQFQTHILPIKDTEGNPVNVTLPTPEAFATQQAAIERIRAKPAEEAKTREQQALQTAELGRMKELEDYRYQHELTLEAMKLHNQLAVDKANNVRAFGIARMNALGPFGGDLGDFGGSTISTGPDGQPTVNYSNPASIVGSYMDQIRTGKLSIEQLRKQFKPAQVSFLMGEATKQGIVPLTDKEVSSMNDMEAIARLTPHLKTLHELRANSPYAEVLPKILGGEARSTRDAETAIARQFLPNLERVLTDTKRMPNATVAHDYAQSLIPDPTISFTNNAAKATAEAKKYYNYIDTVNDSFNTLLRRIPEGQKSIIRGSLGLNDLPALNLNMQNAGAALPKLPGTATPRPPNIPNSYIHVKENASGKEGYVSPGYDASKFTPFNEGASQ